MPPISPPPESGTTTQLSSGKSSSSSRPIVPCPAITSGWSKGEIGINPSSSVSRLASISASSCELPTIRTSAPSDLMASTLFSGTRLERQITARTPCSRAAYATPRPWFPVETATTPRFRWSSFSRKIALVAPRSLKAPVGCMVSSLHQISASHRSESACARTSGVRVTYGEILFFAW